MTNYFIEFNFSCVVSLSLFNVIMFFLCSLEALNKVIIQCALHTCLARYGLDKSNHCFVALRIKLLVGTWFYQGKFSNTILLCVLYGVLTHWWLNIVSKIGNESHAVIKFNVECLVIYRCPSSWNDITWAFSSFLANDSFAFIILHYVQSVNIFWFKIELVVSINQLDPVWHLMCAKLFSVK